jgi:hypothetical protein
MALCDSHSAKQPFWKGWIFTGWNWCLSKAPFTFLGDKAGTHSQWKAQLFLKEQLCGRFANVQQHARASTLLQKSARFHHTRPPRCPSMQQLG